MTRRVGLHFLPPAVLRRAQRSATAPSLASVFQCAEAFASFPACAVPGTTFVPWVEGVSPDAFLADVDVVVGPPDMRLLQARARARAETPYLALVLGYASRGVPFVPEVLGLLGGRDRMVVNCEADRAIIDEFVVPPSSESIVVAPLPSALLFGALAAPPPDDDARRQARRRLDLPLQREVLLVAGRLTPEKATHTVVPLVAALCRRGVEPVVAVVGGVPAGESQRYVDYVSHLAHRCGVAHLLRFVGPVAPADLRTWYTASSIVLSPAMVHDHNFGLVPAEAMAFARAVVAADWGGHRDIVVDGVTGHLMPTRLLSSGRPCVNWLGAADVLEALLTDSATLQRVGANGRAVAEQRFTLRAVAGRYAELAGQALSGSSGAGWRLSTLGQFALTSGWARAGSGPTRSHRDVGGSLGRRIYRHYASQAAPDADVAVYARLPLAIDERTVAVHEYDGPRRCHVPVGAAELLGRIAEGPVRLARGSRPMTLLADLIDEGVLGVHETTAGSPRWGGGSTWHGW